MSAPPEPPQNRRRATVGRSVDWGVAATVGRKLVRSAPPMTHYTREQARAQLADAARRAEPAVREVTGLDAGERVREARLVDRAEWVGAAAESMRVMTGGQQRGSAGGPIVGRVTGAQTGAVLAFVSSGILGQYDPFSGGQERSDPGIGSGGQEPGDPGIGSGGQERSDPGNGSGGQEPEEPGELLLVYPNVVAVERQLRVDPADFRLWVCLHEVTHRVQFRAHPWLAGHMANALAVLTDDVGRDAAEVTARLAGYLRERRRGAGGPDAGVVGLLRALQNDEQRAALDALLVLGTLLEGHADHVMDAVGPAVVPSVETIRRRFDERRGRSQPPLARILRALLGVDAKIAQYTRGKAFVDAVVARVGMERFNAIWSSADTLPQPAEVDEPGRWIDRVL